MVSFKQPLNFSFTLHLTTFNVTQNHKNAALMVQDTNKIARHCSGNPSCVTIFLKMNKNNAMKGKPAIIGS